MQLYVNELMVKKLSIFGAVIAVMLIYYRVCVIELKYDFLKRNNLQKVLLGGVRNIAVNSKRFLFFCCTKKQC